MSINNNDNEEGKNNEEEGGEKIELVQTMEVKEDMHFFSGRIRSRQ